MGKRGHLRDEADFHIRPLARGARLYERRALVYEETLTLLYPWMERVDLTEPIWASADTRPPELPNLDVWRNMRARLATHGSLAVSDAYRALWEAGVTPFYERVNEMRMIQQGDAEGDLPEARHKMEEARLNVRELMRQLEQLVSDELAAL